METTAARGNRIRALRVRKQLSQQALAKLVGVSQSMISTYETGEYVPSVNTLFQLSDALECTLDEMFPRERG